MNTRDEIITAIDIGTTKIVALAGKMDSSGRIKILGIGTTSSQGVKRGMVSNIELTAVAIKAAVEEAERIADCKFENVFVGIAGQHIKSFQTSMHRYIREDLGEITQKDVDELGKDIERVPLEPGCEIIHVIPQSYTVDNESGIKKPAGMAGRKLKGNYHIVQGHTTAVTNIKRCVNRAGFNVYNTILEPLASAEAVLTEEEKEAGVALVDIGGGTTDIAVYYDGIIRHTAVIPFGGNMVTEDIKKGCGLLARSAEALKIQHGSALSEAEKDNTYVSIDGINGREPKEISLKMLASIIEARMAEIIGAIVFELNNSGYSKELAAGVVITGGGSLLKNLVQLMKYYIAMDVRLGYPTKISYGVLNEVNDAKYSTSVGLLMKGYECLKTGNLMERQIDVSVETEVGNNEPDFSVFENGNFSTLGFNQANPPVDLPIEKNTEPVTPELTVKQEVKSDVLVEKPVEKPVEKHEERVEKLEENHSKEVKKKSGLFSGFVNFTKSFTTDIFKEVNDHPLK